MMPHRTFEEAMEDGRRLLPDALRTIATRLESDDMVESTVLRQAADELAQFLNPWQPIETALREVEILITGYVILNPADFDGEKYERTYIGFVKDDGGRVLYGRDSFNFIPTHWMARPTPPDSTERK